MQNTVIQQVERGIWDIVTYSPFVDSVVTVLAIAIPLCFQRVRDYLIKKCKEFINKHKKHHSPEPEDMKRYFSIDNTLAVLQDNTKADRISVCQFHNGESFSVHNPIFKFTCSYEFLTPGVKPAASVVQRLIVSHYMDLIGPLYSDDFLRNGAEHYDTTDKCDECDEIPRMIRYEASNMTYNQTRYLFEGLGVDVMYSVPLFDTKGKLMGVINFQYLNALSDSFEDVDLKDLCDKVKRIQFILNS